MFGTNTKTRLRQYTKSTNPSLTVFSKKKLTPKSRRQLGHQFKDRLSEFRDNQSRTAKQEKELVEEIKAAERKQIEYTRARSFVEEQYDAREAVKYADQRIKNRLSILRDIMTDLRECQDSVRGFTRENFIPRSLNLKKSSVEDLLKMEGQLRELNTRCRVVMRNMALERQREMDERQLATLREVDLSGAGSKIKRRTMAQAQTNAPNNAPPSEKKKINYVIRLIRLQVRRDCANNLY